MSTEDGQVYLLHPEDDEEWVTPQPASEVIVDTVAETTDVDADDIDDLSEYVDLNDLAALFEDESAGDAEASLSFEIEDHEVTVHCSGEIDVESDD